MKMNKNMDPKLIKMSVKYSKSEHLKVTLFSVSKMIKPLFSVMKVIHWA